MSHPIDVGSVLGGRYKVTATVLTSHDHDLVLDGVDQVLNRPVSILVAGPDNAEQVAQSAREVATGERPAGQVLDLGVTEAATYLITNHTSAADLLDLVVASNPPYVEPFFTDTLGSEIFGQARSHEPEPYDDDEENVDAGYINYAASTPARWTLPVCTPPVRRWFRPGPRSSARPCCRRRAAARPAGGRSGRWGRRGRRCRAGTGRGARVRPQPVQREAGFRRGGRSRPSGVGAGPDSPKVSLWSEDDYSDDGQDAQSYDDEIATRPQSQPGRLSRFDAAASAPRQLPRRPPVPRHRRDDGRVRRRRRARARAAFHAVARGRPSRCRADCGTHLRRHQPGQPLQERPADATRIPASVRHRRRTGAHRDPEHRAGRRAAGHRKVSPARATLTSPPPTTGPREAFDGNAASYWSDMEFATEGWGGLATDGVPLFVKLKSPATVSSITLTQLGASGGNISVYTNDRPSLDGAKLVGTNSFTSTDLTMPLAEPVEAQYVIVSIKTLPKLAAPKTRFGYGIRLAEIKVQ